MQHWPVRDLHLLSQLIVASNPFLVKRTLTRLEAGEMKLPEAILLLSGSESPHSAPSQRQEPRSGPDQC